MGKGWSIFGGRGVRAFRDSNYDFHTRLSFHSLFTTRLKDVVSLVIFHLCF